MAAQGAMWAAVADVVTAALRKLRLKHTAVRDEKGAELSNARNKLLEIY